LSVNSVSYRILLSKSIPLVGPIVHLFFCVRHFFLLLSIDEQTFFRKITDSIVWYLRHILCWIKSITKYGREKHSSMYRRLKLNILCCSVKKIGSFFKIISIWNVDSEHHSFEHRRRKLNWKVVFKVTLIRIEHKKFALRVWV
jgi:hypothetical protein